jgi:chromosome partitioning protein
MRTIAIINQKGGVGKTTTTANLAHALVLKDHKVTVIDLDPQGHLSTSLGINYLQRPGLDSVLLHDYRIEDCVKQVRPGLSLVPSGPELGDLEHQAMRGVKRGTRLRDAMSNKFMDQDYVLIDCPPASNLLVINALFSTNEALIPIAGDYLSLQGLSYLIGTFKNFEKLGHKINQWFVMTRFNTRRRLPQQVMDTLKQYFPQQVLATRVREAAALAECPSFGKTIFEYRKNSNGAADYESLALDLAHGRTI